VSYGYQICNRLNYVTGDVLTDRVFYNTSWADVPTRHYAW
jgi:hypothetical protein